MVVEGVDLVGDVVVGVGDGPVGDAGVDEGHAQCLVAEHGGERFEAHAPVDGLGGEGVAELVGVDVSDARCLGDPVDDAGDLVPVDRPVVPDDEPVDVVVAVGVVVVDEFESQPMLTVLEDDCPIAISVHICLVTTNPDDCHPAYDSRAGFVDSQGTASTMPKIVEEKTGTDRTTWGGVKKMFSE